MNRLDAPREAAQWHGAAKSVPGPAHAVADYMQTQQGLLIDLGAALSCAMFSMAVIVGVYYLLDRR
jgi:hypothetical protein